MVETSSIKICSELKDYLDKKKIIEREPYNDVLIRLLGLKILKSGKKE